MRKASLHKRSLKLLLVLSSLGLCKDSTVSNARDVVCLSQHSNLVLILDDPAHSKFINKEVLDQYWDVGGVR